MLVKDEPFHFLQNHQELFEAVEQERKLRVATSRNATIFHHPAFNDFELQHLRMNVNDIELEEQIIQHLAVAAVMRRADQLGRRAGRQANSSPRGHPHSLVLSNIAPAEEENDQTRIPNKSASTPIKSKRNGALQQMLRVRTQSSSSASGSSICSNDRGYLLYIEGASLPGTSGISSYECAQQ
ncbi:hypothetical protein LR48_Vigan08g189500 [Vigna angularis]|uniref:Uncharacterized protein n=1 Tax=Phaseolus angularis TaxID=3914 RepID=A0A0L9V7V9_PHAAN|nr:hypothetical protein LR48_Vigan08g189500 [Vigna angularis]